MVTQDTSSSLCSERRDEYLFGPEKIRRLGQVITKKKKIMKQKKGITNLILMAG